MNLLSSFLQHLEKKSHDDDLLLTLLHAANRLREHYVKTNHEIQVELVLQ